MPQRAVITCGEKNSYSGMGNNCGIIIALDFLLLSIRIAAGRETTQRRLVK